MRAIVTRAFGEHPDTRIEERPAPQPRAGHSLVRMKAATINQLSNFIRTGTMPGMTAPLVLGNEGAGIVERGSRFPAGTRVGIYGGNKLGITEDGLFQEQVLVEDSRLFALPDALGWNEGATLSVNYLTAYRALTKAVRITPGQIVLVSGATGSVGGAVVQVARALGARPIALVSSADKARGARDAGIADVIDLSAHDDLGAAVRALTGGVDADVAADPVGGPVFGRLFGALRPGGTLVSLGFTAGRQIAIDALEVIAGEKTITGYSLHADDDAEIANVLETLAGLAAHGALRPTIDTTVGIDEVEKGYARLTSREAIGSIVLAL